MSHNNEPHRTRLARRLGGSAFVLAAALVLVGLNPDAAYAQAGGLTPFADVALVSDYRFRGVSLSAQDPAIQGGVGVAHRSGFVVGAWGSSIDEFDGAETELDVYASWGRAFGPVRLDAGATAYLYPGAESAEYGELWASAGGGVAWLGWTVGAAVAPAQDNIGGSANRYAFGSLSAPLWGPVSADATVGVEDGAFGAADGGSRVHWDVGGSVAFGDLSARAAYVDTSEVGGLTGSTVVFSLGMAL